jgi:putative MATE family efflux protein
MSNGSNSKTLDMTKGNIYSLVIQFAIPLVLGNLFQELYNMTDTWVLGNYVGNAQYSAVGACAPITLIVLNGMVGFSTGVGIVISRFFGAREDEKLKRSSQTAMVIALFFAVFFTVLGVTLSPAVLKLTRVPEESLEYATTYLRIIFSFISAQVVYNIGSAILRAVGDSRKPFYFLMTASLTNIVLDLLFAIKFHLGVEGVAYATAIAQMLSAILTVIELIRTKAKVRLVLDGWLFDRDICRSMISVGLPTGLQMSLNMVGNTFIQSYINALGTDFLSGYTTYHKVQEVLFTTNNSIGSGCMTFVSQNLGANDAKRAKEGVRASLVIQLVSSLTMVAILLVFAPNIVAFFNSKEEVVRNGTLCIRIITSSFPIHGISAILMYALRGAGNTKGPFISMLVCTIGIRLTYLYLITRFVANTPVTVLLSFTVGWTANFLVILVMYLRTDFGSRAGLIKNRM